MNYHPKIEKNSEDISEPTKKKKKAKKKQVKNKPALNLQVLQNFAQTVPHEEKARKDLSPKELKSQNLKDSSADKENKEEESDNESVLETEDKTVLEPKSATDMLEWKSAFVCDEIVEALAEKGFQSPTPIQKLTLPSALKGTFTGFI